MNILEQLDRVSDVLAEKLAQEARDDQPDGKPQVPLQEDGARFFTSWTNGPGWGNFTKVTPCSPGTLHGASLLPRVAEHGVRGGD